MIKRIHLNESRASILFQIGEYGLLDSRMVHERCLPNVTYRRTQQVLSDLVDAGYLTMTIVTQAEVRRSGQRRKTVTKRLPAFHTLTERGAEALESFCGETPKRISRSDPAPETLRHRHEIVRTRLAIDKSCEQAGLPKPAWIMESDQRGNRNRNLPPNQTKVLYHRFERSNQLFTCQPDIVCCLQLPPSDSTEQIQYLLAAFEIDRSREGVSQLRRSKGRGYDCWLKEECYKSYWPEMSLTNLLVRILWVIPSPKRIESILKADVKTHAIKRYRFLTFSDRDQKNVITDSVWAHENGARSSIWTP